MHSCILWSKKIECTANLAKMVLFQKSSMRQKVLLRRKVRGVRHSDVIISDVDTWNSLIFCAWSSIRLHFVFNCSFLLQALYSSSKSIVFDHTTYKCRFLAMHGYQHGGAKGQLLPRQNYLILTDHFSWKANARSANNKVCKVRSS